MREGPCSSSRTPQGHREGGAVKRGGGSLFCGAVCPPGACECCAFTSARSERNQFQKHPGWKTLLSRAVRASKQGSRRP